MSAQTDARDARRELEPLLAKYSLPLPPSFADAAERYVALLLAANARLNLTRIVEPISVARLHLLDALSALPLVDELAPRRVVDLGSGGGVPGLVLALARPAIDWILVDSVRKKADALRGFVHELGLARVDVRDERAEALGHIPGQRESYDVVMARACAPLAVLAEYALPLLRIGGALVAWKGRMPDDELAAGSAAAALLGGGLPSVHLTAIEELGDHRLIVIRKERSTRATFPRRPGEPARRPLGSRPS